MMAPPPRVGFTTSFSCASLQLPRESFTRTTYRGAIPSLLMWEGGHLMFHRQWFWLFFGRSSAFEAYPGSLNDYASNGCSFIADAADWEAWRNIHDDDQLCNDAQFCLSS
mmetsp:Transcript_53801/g.161015  ORF Transcript_53801/g.161015 Transcript_53801/m.161015 type:complete len:110 (+) Transcript_53801:584-913(+)